MHSTLWLWNRLCYNTIPNMYVHIKNRGSLYFDSLYDRLHQCILPYLANTACSLHDIATDKPRVDFGLYSFAYALFNASLLQPSLSTSMSQCMA